MADWPTYRGKAIEHLVREDIDQLLPDERFGDAAVTGGFWTADHQTEVDLIGADRREGEAGQLHGHCQVAREQADHPGRPACARGRLEPSTLKVGVHRAGVDARAAGAFDVVLGPDDLLKAWADSAE